MTVGAANGVLASVEMVNENGGTVNGQLNQYEMHWSTTEQLGYNRRYTLNAKALGWAGWPPVN